MANLSALFGGKTFKAADVERTETEFKPLPKGDYEIMITESEILPNKSGTGTNLTLKLVVIGDHYQNRVLFDTLCVQHDTSPVAQQIAQTKLAQICDAVKVDELDETSKLHDKPLVAKVKVEIDKYQTEKEREFNPSAEPVFRNSISAYLKSPNPSTSVAIKPKAKAVEEEFDDVPF